MKLKLQNYMKKFKIFLLSSLIIYACNSGISEQKKNEINQAIKSWNDQNQKLTNLEKEIIESEVWFDKVLLDSLGEDGMKSLEKDSLSNERIKSLKNDYANWKNDYANLLSNYKTLTTETENWSKNLDKTKQSSDEINEEWESKQTKVQEILSQKEAYKQALSSIKTSYMQAVSEIKAKMKKK
jgi:chromosome segregation ATPase